MAPSMTVDAIADEAIGDVIDGLLDVLAMDHLCNTSPGHESGHERGLGDAVGPLTGVGVEHDPPPATW